MISNLTKIPGGWKAEYSCYICCDMNYFHGISHHRGSILREINFLIRRCRYVWA